MSTDQLKVMQTKTLILGSLLVGWLKYHINKWYNLNKIYLKTMMGM